MMAAEKALKGLFSAVVNFFENPFLFFDSPYILSDITCPSCIHFELH